MAMTQSGKNANREGGYTFPREILHGIRHGFRTEGDRIFLSAIYTTYAIYSFSRPTNFIHAIVWGQTLNIIISVELIIASVMVVLGIFAQNYLMQFFGLMITMLMFLTLFVVGTEVDSFDNGDFKSLILVALIGVAIMSLRRRYRIGKTIDTITTTITEEVGEKGLIAQDPGKEDVN